MTISTIRDDPGLWRRRAQESRAMAEQMADPAEKKIMIEIAEAYEQLALLAERRGAAKQT